MLLATDIMFKNISLSDLDCFNINESEFPQSIDL